MNFDGRKTCPTCTGFGRVNDGMEWNLCTSCRGIGRVFESGGPLFDCTISLAECNPGEIVLLATGRRARVQWQMPRKDPDTTFVGLFDDFDDDIESHAPRAVPSCLGVRSIERRRPHDPKDQGVGSKATDVVDPMNRHASGVLL